jgi:hypothetical protein
LTLDDWINDWTNGYLNFSGVTGDNCSVGEIMNMAITGEISFIPPACGRANSQIRKFANSQIRKFANSHFIISQKNLIRLAQFFAFASFRTKKSRSFSVIVDQPIVHGGIVI